MRKWSTIKIWDIEIPFWYIPATVVGAAFIYWAMISFILIADALLMKPPV
jgi:hypothetical protein